MASTDSTYNLSQAEQRVVAALRKMQERNTNTVPQMITVRVVDGIVQIYEAVPRGVVDTKPD